MTLQKSDAVGRDHGIQSRIKAMGASNVSSAYVSHDITGFALSSSGQAKSRFLAHALKYASNFGWRVLPVLDKVPATNHGIDDATSAPEELGALFAARRHNGIGVRCGGPARLVAVELDLTGHKQTTTPGAFHRLAGVQMGAYRTPSYHTPNGARMLCFAPASLDLNFGALDLVPGITVFGDLAQVVLPPSEHPSAKTYGPWYAGLDPWAVDVAPLPAALVERIKALRPSATAPAEHAHHHAAPAPGTPDLATVREALSYLDPWADGYAWWWRILASLHSAFPGDDGLALALWWADGKPGEVERLWTRYLKQTGNRSGAVTIGTLFHFATRAGWARQTAPEPDNALPWTITPDDWRACPSCRMRKTTLYDDGSVGNGPDFCHNPKCPVTRKIKMGRALRFLLSYRGIRCETVPVDAWRHWRENAKRGGRRYLAMPQGDRRIVFVETSEADTGTQAAMIAAAADCWTQRTGNLSRSHEPKPAPAHDDTFIPARRPKPVERWFVSQPEQRRELLDVLRQLGIAYERRPYGGWRTAPLDADTQARLRLALASVPGTLPLTTLNIASSSTCELHAPGTGASGRSDPPAGVFVTARDARMHNARHERRAMVLDKVPLW